MNYNDLLLKVAKDYECKECHYITGNKNNFKKHLNTLKHQNTTKYNKKLQNVAQSCKIENFLCNCGKKYKHRASLYNHKKTCEFIEMDISENIITENIQGHGISSDEKNNHLIKVEDQMDYKQMFLTLLNENKEFKDILIKQQNQICDLIPKVGNTVNTVNNVNQKLNINIFLNEKCKDALNINEFVKNIEIDLEQIDYTKTNGLAEGLSNAIIENMNKLSVFERPLHCTDAKRETLYIKDNDNWEKDDDKTKIKKAIKDVSNKQFRSIKKWTDANPDFQEDESKQDYFARVLSILGRDSATVDDKVIKKLCNNSQLKKLIDTK